MSSYCLIMADNSNLSIDELEKALTSISDSVDSGKSDHHA